MKEEYRRMEPRNHESLVAIQNRDFMYLEYFGMGYAISIWINFMVINGDHVQKWGISASNQQDGKSP